MQFLAIEIARYASRLTAALGSLSRNKLGLNDWIYEAAQKSKAS
jgi:hypothetical protein